MDMTFEFTRFPVYATATAGLVLLLQMGLMINVVRLRGASSTLFGSGDGDLLQAIRVHGNLAENSGIFVATFALLEMAGGAAWAVASLCALFVIARIAHAIGLTRSTGVNPLRLVGALGTLFSGVIGGAWATWLAGSALLA